MKCIETFRERKVSPTRQPPSFPSFSDSASPQPFSWCPLLRRDLAFALPRKRKAGTQVP